MNVDSRDLFTWLALIDQVEQQKQGYIQDIWDIDIVYRYGKYKPLIWDEYNSSRKLLWVYVVYTHQCQEPHQEGCL